ncbi:MAG: NAD(P)-binding protein [Sphingomonas taxi]
MARTVVVGGGAAGIAAARALHDAGEAVLLVEAGARLGGRALTWRLALPDWGVGSGFHAGPSAPPAPGISATSLSPTTSVTPFTSVTPAEAGVFPGAGETHPNGKIPAFAGMTGAGGVTGGGAGMTGGRGRTVTVDAGCGWLHSAARNPWTAIAERNRLRHRPRLTQLGRAMVRPRLPAGRTARVRRGL